MKTTLLTTLTFLSGAFALPQTTTTSSPAPSSTPTGPFGLMSIRSGSDIQYAQIAAADSHFWIGRATNTYCPSEPSIPCASLGNQTYVQLNGDSLSMDAIVPGGQQVYVGPKGALRFTTAHSSEMPKGSTVGGFSVTDEGAFSSVGHVGGFVACPVHEKRGGAPYQIFVQTEGFKRTDCEGFDLAAVEVDGAVPAWEYV